MSGQANRIVFVCPRFAGGGNAAGGAETLLKSLAIRVAAAGREVSFLTTCATDHFTWANDRPPGRDQVDGLDVHYFPVDEGRDLEGFLRVQERISRGHRVSRDDELLWLRQNVNSTALCTHLAEHREHYDRVVMGPYLFGLIYHAAAICPGKTILVPCLHDETFAYLSVFRDMFRGVRGFMFNTEPERDLAARLYGLTPPVGPVVGMGLDPFDADPDAFRIAQGIATPYVIYCGRREPMKGTPLLMDYMTAYRARSGRDVRLVLTGSGPVTVPDELAPYTLDAGFVSEPDKRSALAGAVVFCHPSVNESLSIVLLEAWLARTPALVHARGAVLRDQCRRSGGGLWFRNYPEFEEELTTLLDAPDLRTRMGQAGRTFALREYGWEVVEKRLLAALDA